MGKYISNDDRARLALQCVEFFKTLTITRKAYDNVILGMAENDEHSEAMSDLLCDMMHLADWGEEHGFKVEWHKMIATARQHYNAETAFKCENCLKTMEEDVLDEITNLRQRVAIGEPMPAGECPSCGALVHLNDKEATT
jgi:hypothetical protein